MGGHRDKQKHLMVHNSSTLQPQSIRLQLFLARALDFDIWTADVTQAYLQSTNPLLRDIYVTKRVPEFELEPQECLKLLKPLYGLCDAGDLWSSTMDKHHRNILKMTPLRSEPALYAKHIDEILIGMSGTYVDDLLRTGTPEFRKICRTTHDTFDMGKEESLPCSFTGFFLEKNDLGDILQNQKSYLRHLECVSPECSFSEFRSIRMKFAWLSHTRADCLFEISQLAQITEQRFAKERAASIKRLNKAIMYATRNDISIRIPKLDLATLRVLGFSDSSFANNCDLSSQLGHIVLVIDANNNSVPIVFKSYKSRRVVRSAMAGEVIAFSDMFDVAVILSSELRKMLNQPVPLHLLTDNKGLFDIIATGSKTSEKRLMLDIAAAREGFRDKVISDIGFVRTDQNIADGLTKQMFQAALQRVLSKGTLNSKPE